jgi:S1-C subfamily serine protease
MVRRTLLNMRSVLPAALMTVCFGCISAPGEPPSPVLADPVYARLQNATVEILDGGRLNGTGWAAGDGRDVITAAHVVWTAKPDGIEVVTRDKRRLPATMLAIDPAFDTALLRIGEDAPALEPLPLRDGAVPPGTRVWLLGSPVMRHRILLGGTMGTSVPAPEWVNIFHAYAQDLYISGPSPEGVSGGAWVDSEGRVVGVQSGLISLRGEGMAGIASAGLISGARDLLKTRTSPSRAWLGCALEEVIEQGSSYIRGLPRGREGLVVRLLRPGSPAEQAGLKDGMLVIAVGGRPVTRRDDAQQVLLHHRPGDPMKIEVLDPKTGDTRPFTVTPIALRPRG